MAPSWGRRPADRAAGLLPSAVHSRRPAVERMGRMPHYLIALGLPLLAAASASPFLRAQAAQAPRPAAAQPAPASSAPADLAGDWEPDRRRGGFGQSMSVADMGGRQRGKEPDIPYQPWARE